MQNVMMKYNNPSMIMVAAARGGQVVPYAFGVRSSQCVYSLRCPSPILLSRNHSTSRSLIVNNDISRTYLPTAFSPRNLSCLVSKRQFSLDGSLRDRATNAAEEKLESKKSSDPRLKEVDNIIEDQFALLKDTYGM